MATDVLKPTIFLAFANDRSDDSRYLRNLPKEQRYIEDALLPAEAHGQCRIISVNNIIPSQIVDKFLEPRYRDHIAVFHFGGHSDSYRLLFETAAARNPPWLMPVAWPPFSNYSTD